MRYRGEGGGGGLEPGELSELGEVEVVLELEIWLTDVARTFSPSLKPLRIRDGSIAPNCNCVRERERVLAKEKDKSHCGALIVNSQGKAGRASGGRQRKYRYM